MSPGSSEINGSMRPYRRIAAELRAEIESGQPAVGAQIPTQESLLRRFGVSRATVQRALDELRQDGYIDSGKGRGSYVLDRGAARHGLEPDTAMLSLRAHIAAAFEEPEVRLDVFSLTAETLHSALQEPLLRIREGKLRPESIRVRLLLPSPDASLAIPRSVADPADDRPLRRLRHLVSAHAITLRSTFDGLSELGLVPDLSVMLRSVPITPVVKLYLINGRTALNGYYQVLERRISYEGEFIDIYDVLGLDAILFSYQYDENDADSRGSQFVRESQKWFDSLWSTIAEELTLFE
ncbi:GntR family transcriptional regulator [Streptomyces sp. H10-C2]|uniref:GntR family transcriptional regulator n=1 Tax=unclassified Streptomyces TaxID=2593676 RepID=UPI0024B89301|nr:MULTISPECIES: GntR family transcriptional regulator [unclassified Streptomyces]MDJ0345072.1 GntR family transcriptional regulator [Streptomyces sp. PH10-H1]MDJ0373977.1 GntR family transcriptional regulator [Streptomyces sp. H10-C2]